MTAPSQRPARQTPVGSAGQACIGPKSPFTGTEWTPPLDARLAQSGTVLSVEASRLDRATDRCSCKRSPCTAHSQTGVVANVHHARRTARPAELQTFTMHGAQPARSLDLPRSSCVAHSQTGGAELGPPTRSQHLKKKARRRAKPKPTTGAPRRRPAEGRSRRPASHAKRKVVGGAATTAGDRESSRMCPCCGGER